MPARRSLFASWVTGHGHSDSINLDLVYYMACGNEKQHSLNGNIQCK